MAVLLRVKRWANNAGRDQHHRASGYRGISGQVQIPTGAAHSAPERDDLTSAHASLA
ncbi:hypothetical protein [Achromobacter sp.]|uniref:hypothetical protein n=1 Tax=Achromobacter sp. TaxID=134375 RepID=UPI0028B07F1C|nr:hypothetical protein [Achromobacter sp.]